MTDFWICSQRDTFHLGLFPLPTTLEPSRNKTMNRSCWTRDSVYLIFSMTSISSLIGDPIGQSLLNNLELLEGLASYLDGEDPHGNPKCWKHLAQHFGVEASRYETFTCSPRSPTEKLFTFVISRDADTFTIEMLKSGLRDIDRGDIITDILVEHQVLGKRSSPSYFSAMSLCRTERYLIASSLLQISFLINSWCWTVFVGMECRLISCFSEI